MPRADPYQDFVWPYGPGQPYLLAAAAEVFGQSLLWWRILRVACDAGVALLVFLMLRGRVPLWLALAGWLCAACAMAQPVSANPFPAALLAGLARSRWSPRGPPSGARGCGRACCAASRRRGGWTSGCTRRAPTGLAILLRDGATGRERAAEALRFAGTAVAAGLLLYAPFLVAAGPAEMYDQLVATAGRERDYWTLPFPVGYDGPFSLWPPGVAAERGKDVLGFYVPLLVMAGTAVAALAALATGRHGCGHRRAWLRARPSTCSRAPTSSTPPRAWWRWRWRCRSACTRAGARVAPAPPWRPWPRSCWSC